MNNSKHFKNLAGWRNWLQENHNNKFELWLIYYKKHTEKETISYEDSVQEALCWGLTASSSASMLKHTCANLLPAPTLKTGLILI